MKVGEIDAKDVAVFRIVKIGWRYVDVEISIWGLPPFIRRLRKNDHHHCNLTINLER